MDTKTEVVVNKTIPMVEDERIEFSESLGIKTQRIVADGKADWQRKKSKDWIWFSSGRKLVSHLARNYKLFGFSLGFFTFTDFYGMKNHAHEINDYPQRIPMGVLIKLKEAMDSNLFTSFHIIDPKIEVPKCDPFLIGCIGSYYIGIEREFALICQWEDKTV